MKKRLFSLCLAIALLLAMLPQTVLIVNATKVVNSGTCGDNLTWTFDDNGLLTISGHGDMSEFAITYNLPPWNAQKHNIKSIKINEGVTSVGSCAFEDCWSLKSVSLPAGLLSIGGSAFQSCSNLETIYIPESVNSIGYTPFLGCRKLKEILVDKNNSNYSNDEYGVLYDKNKTMLIQFPGKISGIYYVPEGVEWIGFGHCEYLTQAYIPSSVKTIDFYGTCGGHFKGFVVSDENKVYTNDSSGVLYSKDKSQLIWVPEGLSGHYTILDSTTTIVTHAFMAGNDVTSVEIPVSVSKIELYAFSSPMNLSDVYYGGTPAQWNKIKIQSSNDALLNATIHYESSTSEAGSSANDYVEAVQNAIKDNNIYTWTQGRGAMCDIDGNGVEELLMCYFTKLDPDSEFDTSAAVFSAYTMSGDKVVPLFEREFLYYDVGAPWGYIGVVKKDGKTYFATTSSNGYMDGSVEGWNGNWALYKLDKGSLSKDTLLEYTGLEENGSIVQNKSSVTINGQKFGYSEYEEWRDEIEELLVVYPYEDEWSEKCGHTMTLDELLEYLKKNPVEDTSLPEDDSKIGNNYHFEIYSPYQELAAEEGKHIQIICKLYSGDQIVTDWEQPGISIGNTDIVSYVACESVEGGYCLTLKGNKEGTATITVFDAESGTTQSILIDVTDSKSSAYNYILGQVPRGYPDSFWDREVLTNFYNFNGLYVTGLEKTVEPDNGVYHLNFNVYNTRYMHGSVDVYNQASEWIQSVRIDKNANVRGVWDVMENGFFALCDLVEWNGSFTGSLTSTETVVNIDVPEGGYFVISNNFYESPAVYLYNGIDYAIYAANKTLDFTITNESIKDIQDKTIQQVLKSPEFKEIFENTVLKNAAKMAADASGNVLTVNLADSAGNIANQMIGILGGLQIDFWDVTASVTDIAVDVFTSFLPPQVSQALDFMFTTSEVTDLLGQLDNIAKSYGKPYIRIYTAGGCKEVTVEGITAKPSENSLPDNAVLQVSRIVNTETLNVPEIDLETNEYKLYDISYSSDGAEVQPNGSVAIRVPAPKEYDWDEYAVLHQQKDGTWIVEDSVVKNDVIEIEVDHFSIFAIVDGDLIPQSNSGAPIVLIVLTTAIVSMVMTATIIILVIKNRKKSSI